jgi:hypothetical protein
MPPQQGERMADGVGELLGFGAHVTAPVGRESLAPIVDLRLI